MILSRKTLEGEGVNVGSCVEEIYLLINKQQHDVLNLPLSIRIKFRHPVGILLSRCFPYLLNLIKILCTTFLYNPQSCRELQSSGCIFYFIYAVMVYLTEKTLLY